MVKEKSIEQLCKDYVPIDERMLVCKLLHTAKHNVCINVIENEPLIDSYIIKCDRCDI